MFNLGDRIKQRRKQLNMSQQELADKLGYTSRSSITKIEKGDNDIPRSKVEEIALILQTTPAYLMGWDNDPKPKSAFFNRNTSHNIPVYDNIPANVPFEAIKSSLDDLEIPNRVARKGDLFALKMSDDSMDKEIKKGALVVFKKADEVKQGCIAAIQINGEDTVIRHFTKTLNGAIIECNSHSDNEDYKYFFLEDEKDTYNIIGSYVWNCMDPNEID